MTGWHSIYTYGTEGERTLSLYTAGCGCCCEGENTQDVDKAIEYLEGHIEELKGEVAHWEAYRAQLVDTRVIQEIK